eukprot:TRINITY_DN66424_c0_g1_i1.p1 TRINITY_DN66424_c0_g1~~TRINITY_DN66424_c0_g1_i1.p1  ORF type:complete len:487 (+),score=102.10 TRINITY_DN66424_c0_g1_i1:132-1592(+)
MNFSSSLFLLPVVFFYCFEPATGSAPSGCNSSNSPSGVTFVTGAVYGCDGNWNGGMSAAEVLCSTGHHVCSMDAELLALGLTKEVCRNSVPEGKWYASKVSGLWRLNQWGCDIYGTSTNDVFGCAKTDTADTATCSVLNSRKTMYSGGDGWAFTATQQQQPLDTSELNAIQHNNISSGGVMCCKNGPVGCSSSSPYGVTFVSGPQGSVYGCAGTWSGGISAANSLCAPGFTVCSTDNQLTTIGLTKSVCRGSVRGSQWYGSKVSGADVGNNVWGCDPGGASSNDVWGCSATDTGAASGCQVLNHMRSMADSSVGGWTYPGSTGTNEADHISHSDPSTGGAMCCREGCNPGYYGTNCSLGECGSQQPLCNGNGFCNDGQQGDGKCSCDYGWEGTDCSMKSTGVTSGMSFLQDAEREQAITTSSVGTRKGGSSSLGQLLVGVVIGVVVAFVGMVGALQLNKWMNNNSARQGGSHSQKLANGNDEGDVL